MKKEQTILWQPTGKQAEFLSCPAREALFAGSVGSGKTEAILMAGLSQVKNPKHRALILRRTFPMLRDVIGRSHELFLPLGATFNKGTSQWTFPSGAILEFGFPCNRQLISIHVRLHFFDSILRGFFAKS